MPAKVNTSPFALELGARVGHRIFEDRELTVVGRAEYVDREPSYLVEWRDADGERRDEWLSLGEIVPRRGRPSAAARPASSRRRRRSSAKSRRSR